jgi:hypothetical protein
MRIAVMGGERLSFTMLPSDFESRRCQLPVSAEKYTMRVVFLATKLTSR